MTRSIARRFRDPEQLRKRLVGLFTALGSDNANARETARGGIDSLLREVGQTWSDLVALCGGDPAALNADLACDIVALGAEDANERDAARRRIADLLTYHRKTWSDLVNAIGSKHPEAWACGALPNDRLPRVNALDLVHAMVGRFVVLKPYQQIAVALWIVHTHVYNQFMVTPHLVLRSPVANCGKTTLLDIVAKLTARAEKFDSITVAGLVRLIDEQHPTLLIDEADNFNLTLPHNGRMRRIFNSGHRKGGTEGLVEHGKLRKFSTFTPLALALPQAVGGLPRASNSRSITINLERADDQHKLERFDADRPDPDFDITYRAIWAWQREVVLDCDPELPETLRNRFADNWRVLIAVADSFGRGWGELAREAALIFSREHRDADARILLLVDIRKIFNACGLDRLSTKTLLEALHGLDDADAEWREFDGVRGDQQPHKLRDTEVGVMLRDFGIRSRSIWPLNRTASTRSAKGYRRTQFEKAWRQYCGDDGTAAQSSNVRALRPAGGGTE